MATSINKYKCLVPGCDSKPSEEFKEGLGKTIRYQFHAFPREEERRQEWFWHIGFDSSNKITKLKDRKCLSKKLQKLSTYNIF